MNVKCGTCLLFWVCALGAVGQQQPELQGRNEQEKRASELPPPPAPMKIPEKL